MRSESVLVMNVKQLGSTTSLHIHYTYFFEKKIYFHKTNLKKSYIQYQTHYTQKERNKGKKKRLEILKEGRNRNGGSHYVIQTIERHNPFKMFSLYTYYAID